jgi:hypothetical protein
MAPKPKIVETDDKLKDSAVRIKDSAAQMERSTARVEWTDKPNVRSAARKRQQLRALRLKRLIPW